MPIQLRTHSARHDSLSGYTLSSVHFLLSVIHFVPVFCYHLLCGYHIYLLACLNLIFRFLVSVPFHYCEISFHRRPYITRYCSTRKAIFLSNVSMIQLVLLVYDNVVYFRLLDLQQ